MTDISAGIAAVEFELIIRDCPPYSCSCRCPGYNRDPCAACTERPVLSVETERYEMRIDGGHDLK